MISPTLRLWIACALLVSLSGLAPPPPETVPLDELARELGLEAHRDAATDRVVLDGAGTRVVMAPGLATLLHNGRPRTFAYPVSREAGRIVVPAEIAGWLIRNIAPPSSPDPRPPEVVEPERRLAGFRITLDPGHGGKNTGALGHYDLVEKELNLQVALRVAERLEEQGAEVTLTRRTDRHLSAQWREDLRLRWARAKETRAHAFVSIHTNWAQADSARGFEIYVRRSASAGDRALASAVRRPLRRATKSPDRGIKKKDFIVIRDAPCPAILVEMDFISNRESARLMNTAAHRRRLADAISDGIARWRLE